MISEIDEINDLLRNGREINSLMRNSDLLVRLEKTYHFLELKEKDFFRCIHEDDGDFDIISDDQRRCDAEIEIIPRKVKYVCPQCHRIIYLEDKKFRFKKYQVAVMEKNVRKFIKNSFKDSGFKYLREGSLTFDQEKFLFYKFTCNSIEFGVSVMNKIPDKSLLDWIEIYSSPIIFVLFDSAALSAQRILEGRKFRFIDIGTLVTLEEKNKIGKLLDLAKKCTTETKIKLLSSLPNVIEKLENREIDYYNYEQCIYVLLKFMLDSTDKFGNSHICKELPDGFFTISPPKGKQYGFYVYDCKFTGEKRKLTSSDYRAIYDYIRNFRTSPAVIQSNFHDIDGFIIFSHNLPIGDLEKTLGHIRSYSMRDERNPWNGKLIYFETDSLILLAKSFFESRGEFERRKTFFYDYLNLFLHDEDLHQDTNIKKKGIIHISKDDIRNMIELILQKDPEEQRIDTEALLEDLRSRGLISSYSGITVDKQPKLELP